MLDSIFKDFHRKALSLPFLGKLSRDQYKYVRRSFSVSRRKIICYRTVQRYWKKKTSGPVRVPTATFFQAIESGDRVITSQNVDTEHHAIGHQLIQLAFVDSFPYA